MSRNIKKSISLSGHRTSLSLEPSFWDALSDAAALHDMTLPQYISKLESDMLACGQKNLSSFIRVTLFDFYRDHDKNQ